MRSACAPILMLLVACSGAGRGPGQEEHYFPPAVRMTMLVFRDVTPGVDPASFNAQPRTLYRLGERFGRMEYPVDGEQGVHLLAIVNEPHIFAINQLDGTGQYSVDPGPTYVFRSPVFKKEDVPPPLGDLEYGKEFEFLRAHQATSSTVVGEDGRPRQQHEALFGELRVVVIGPAGSRAAETLHVYQTGELVHAIKYDAYRTDLPPRAELFKPPEGVQIFRQQTGE
jgi:hypothetical protein